MAEPDSHPAEQDQLLFSSPQLLFKEVTIQVTSGERVSLQTYHQPLLPIRPDLDGAQPHGGPVRAASWQLPVRESHIQLGVRVTGITTTDGS